MRQTALFIVVVVVTLSLLSDDRLTVVQAAARQVLYLTQAAAFEHQVLGTSTGETAPNTLTADEVADGWQLLFDGESLSAWRGFKQDGMPGGWQAVDGTLARVAQAGDIITVEEFDDFELAFDWRVETGDNSGVFFRVTEAADLVWQSGPEFQVLHNEGHPDGRSPITSAGSNYAVHPPARDVTRPVGEWNTSRIIVRGRHVEHWMNGVQLVEYELGSADWIRRVEASKFAPLARYGREPSGHIAIQDHGDPVAYRNLKVRRLSAP